MPASTTKIVPPYSPRGLYLLSPLIGGLIGLAMPAEERWTYSLMQSDFAQRHFSPFLVSTLALVLIIGAVFIPAVIVGGVLSCLSQKKSLMSIAGALAGAAQLLVSLLADQVLWSLHGGADWRGWPIFAFLVNLAFIAGLSTLGALLVRWLIRSVLFTVVEQDGTRCPRCGYQLGGPTITTCPECGTPADPSRLSFRRLSAATHWLQHRSRRLAALLLVLVCIQLPFTISRRTIPACRFLHQFPQSDDLGPVAMIPEPPPPGSFNSGCMGSWMPMPGDPSLIVVVLYIPDRNSPLTPMRLAIAQPLQPNPTTPPGPQLNFGAPQVACDLPRDLAERINREGIPSSLLQALDDKARENAWGATPAAAVIFSPGPQTLWVDAGPHFVTQ